MEINTDKKLNVPLSQEMHQALFSEAHAAGVPATRLVRSLLEDWLEQRRRERRREEVRKFALKHAGSTLDLEPELEVAATEELVRVFDEDSNETR